MSINQAAPVDVGNGIAVAQEINPGIPGYTWHKIDANQQELLSQALALVQWQAPGFTHVLYSMMNQDGSDTLLYFTKDIPTMSTDGAKIFANPDFFFSKDFPLRLRVAGIAHEVLHGIFHHCWQGYELRTKELPVAFGTKSFPYDPKFANGAMDYVINAVLKESGIGELGAGWLYDPKIATSDTSWQEAYVKIYKPSNKGGGGGQMPGQFDHHMDPGTSQGKDPADPMAAPNPQAWQQAVAGAMAVAEAQGKLPANLKKLFEAMLQPKVSWTDHIQGLFARRVGSGGYDFRRPDRRLIVRDIVAPGRSGHGCGTIVVGVDTSGSIYAVPSLIERFFAEVSGILEDLAPKRIVVVWCDAQVQRVDDVVDAQDLRDSYYKGAQGGGGTSFEPVFEHVEELGLEEIDALVYLTDGDGTFPATAPTYPVIWGDISAEPAKYPWGEVVEIPTDGTA